MKTAKRLLNMVAITTMAIMLSCGGSEKKDDDTGFKRGDTPLEPYAQAQALGKGVNFGNLLDADPEEGSWTSGLVTEEAHFDIAKEAGFDSIRIPIRFAGHASQDSPYTIDPDFFKRVDTVIAWGLKKELKIVIDIHHYDAMMTDAQGNRQRFIALWKQIASRYTNYPGELYYEILNEPYGNLSVELWNEILAECIAEIRKVDDYHTIIVPATMNSYLLDGLVIPDSETNAIVTFHYYTPFLFCFQGKSWAGTDAGALSGIEWPGPPSAPLAVPAGLNQWAIDWLDDYNTIADPDQNPAGPGIIRDEIAAYIAWGNTNKRPLWMGEFCAQDGGDLASRARWTDCVRTELEKNNIPWSFWTLLSDGGTRLYNPDTKKWTIELTDALGLDVSN